MARDMAIARVKRQPSQQEDWSAILAVALLVGLWLLWPRRAETKQEPPLPEPSCAYVSIPGTFRAPAVRARASGVAGRFVRLPAIPLPPFPEREAAPAVSAQPPKFDLALDDPDSLLPAPPARPYKPDALPAAGFRASAGLAAASFSFDASSITSQVPFSLKARLSFSQDGRLSSFFVDEFDGDRSILLLLRQALLFTPTSGAAHGSVLIWNKGK